LHDLIDEDLDFLNDGGPDASAGPAALNAALERWRPEILSWSAAAGAARSPETPRARGPKGRLLWQQEMNLHVRHLHQAMVADGTESLGVYATWARRRHEAGQMQAQSMERTLAILCEGLARHLEAAHAQTLVQALTGAFDIEAPPHVAEYLGLGRHSAKAGPVTRG